MVYFLPRPSHFVSLWGATETVKVSGDLFTYLQNVTLNQANIMHKTLFKQISRKCSPHKIQKRTVEFPRLFIWGNIYPQ